MGQAAVGRAPFGTMGIARLWRLLVRRADAHALLPHVFATSCCATSLGFATRAAGVLEEAVLAPEEADLLVVAGPVTRPLAPLLKRVRSAMLSPSYTLLLGACAGGGGPWAGSYNVIADVGTLMPVDARVPGCPPSRDALLAGLALLRGRLARS